MVPDRGTPQAVWCAGGYRAHARCITRAMLAIDLALRPGKLRSYVFALPVHLPPPQRAPCSPRCTPPATSSFSLSLPSVTKSAVPTALALLCDDAALILTLTPVLVARVFSRCQPARVHVRGYWVRTVLTRKVVVGGGSVYISSSPLARRTLERLHRRSTSFSSGLMALLLLMFRALCFTYECTSLRSALTAGQARGWRKEQCEPSNNSRYKVADEELKLHQEEFDSLLQERLEGLVNDHIGDFPDDDDQSPIAMHAAAIARAHITDGTRKGHQRVIKAYFAYHLKRDPMFDPMAVNGDTPKRIREFIMQKCGNTEAGYEGRKYSTAVATRAALTLWYRSIRPNESTTDWLCDKDTGICRGLPTRSRLVSEFMVGLEKTKAKAGEVSASARALSDEDMRRLHDLCFNPNQTAAEKRKGVVRYVRAYFDVKLATRKSAQTGVQHVWRLYANDEDPRLCPMRALIRLSMVYGPEVSTSGPLFLRVNQIGAVTSEPLTNFTLSKALTGDLQALGYADWALFGTHSFRRGGCQYRIRVKDWDVAMVAAWGGWSQVEAITMFRYFYSPKDNHEYMTEYDRNTKRVKRG
ncbi:hypothetical protein HWV62_35061 [Athelia sp. TMB]|nr:hypothetical protein HWV62_35061 [Athelia sp. TMB]